MDTKTFGFEEETLKNFIGCTGVTIFGIILSPIVCCFVPIEMALNNGKYKYNNEITDDLLDGCIPYPKNMEEIIRNNNKYWEESEEAYKLD